jgi:hypothetical protein
VVRGRGDKECSDKEVKSLFLASNIILTFVILKKVLKILAIMSF